MQQLQNASDFGAAPVACAADVLEAVLDVMLLVREQIARRHAGREGATPTTLIHVRAMGVLRKRPGATLSLLAGQLALTLSATSRLVECLVSKGLVAREIPGENRRTVSLRLTPAGTRLHRRALAEAQRELARNLKTLTAAERGQLSRCMRRLSKAMGESNSTAE
jgi:DNA-binding MarR family transcriptional regulator